MEQTNRIGILVIILSFFWINAYPNGKNSLPRDPTTIEALIDAHKKMKEAEDLAIKELAATTVLHTETKSLADKYNEVKSFLNERMADAGSYVTLASDVANVLLKLESLYENYKYFTEITYSNAKRQPFLLLSYTSTNAELASEIKHIATKCAEYTGFQNNILKATMAEKRKLLYYISSHINSCDMIIRHANMICRSMLNTGLQEYHVRDLINSANNNKIMSKVIESWKKKSSE